MKAQLDKRRMTLQLSTSDRDARDFKALLMRMFERRQHRAPITTRPPWRTNAARA